MARKVRDWSEPFIVLVGKGAVFPDFAIQASCNMHASGFTGVTFRECRRLQVAQEFLLPGAGWPAKPSAPPTLAFGKLDAQEWSFGRPHGWTRDALLRAG